MKDRKPFQQEVTGDPKRPSGMAPQIRGTEPQELMWNLLAAGLKAPRHAAGVQSKNSSFRGSLKMAKQGPEGSGRFSPGNAIRTSTKGSTRFALSVFSPTS